MTEKKELEVYDRQIYTIGMDAMKKLLSSSCLISGMNGAGVEIAKNVILSGIKVVTIHDTEKTTFEDLSTQFYLTEADIGRNRAEACLSKLAGLNDYVQVRAITTPLNEETIKQFKVVVLVNHCEEDIVKIAEIFRKNNVKFMVANANGLYCRVFVDDGDAHVVTDDNGERIQSYAIGNIIPGKKTLIDLVDGETHDLGSDDYVTFSLVEGMEELNTLPQPVKVIPHKRISFYVDLDSTNFHEYTNNGYVTQAKVPKTISHKPYTEECKAPTIVSNGDFAHFTRPSTLHSCFLALDEFRKAHSGSLPKPHDEKDAQEFAEIAKKVHESIFPDADSAPFEEDTAKLFGRISAGSTAPISSAIGGIVGQEIMKAVTNKLTPLGQWLFLDCSECLDMEHLPTPEDCAPKHSRYDGQIAIFGATFQEKLLNAKVFLVGSGAIGCEALKNFALMGISAGPNGLITVTDMDTIELSNLSRQFLFRQKDISHSKSQTASEAVKQINPNLHIVARTDKVGTETENIFNTQFWSSLDFVANALDNVESRRYVDQQCVRHHKPLFECGTLGTKGNTQSVIPFLTECYSDSVDPPEKDLPMCTVKNMPYMIEHTIEYARGQFVELFTDQLSDAASYLRDPKAYLARLEENRSSRNTVVSDLLRNIVDERPRSFEDCIKWGKKVFTETFSNQIKQLLFNFPPNATTSEGLPFWSGKRRQPSPIEFDKTNPLHISFILSAACIRASAYNIPVPSDLNEKMIGDVADAFKLPEFVPRTGVQIEFNDNAKSEDKEEEVEADSSSSLADAQKAMDSDKMEEDAQYEALVKKLPQAGSADLAGLTIIPVDFEKDDDTNHHIDYITACANLRAINYQIPPTDRAKVKLISGKIIPALATTTGLISGLTMCDLLTYTRGAKDLESYRSWTVNLSINTYVISEPLPPRHLESSSFTIWDQIVLDFTGKPVPSLQEIMDLLKAQKGWEISMVNYQKALLYMSALVNDAVKARLAMPLTKCIEDVQKTDIPDGTSEIVLIVGADNPEDEYDLIELPSVIVNIDPVTHQ